MTVSGVAAFLIIAGFAGYVQTLTGFAFGLMLMGAVALSGLMPLPEAAVFTGLLTLVNAIQMLLRGWRHVDRRGFWLVMAASLPSLLVGYGLLTLFSEGGIAGGIGLLKLLLGAIIMVSSLQLALKAEPLAARSSDRSFLFFGTLSGVMGGLFSTAGPPLVYHLYRQPLALVTIRETLVAVFGLNAVIRLALVIGHGDLPPASAAPCLLAIPVVMAATALARRFPPAVTQKTMRRIVFVLLFLSGLSLALPAAYSFFGALT